MEKVHQILIDKVAGYVKVLLENELPVHMYFHDFEHTLLVAEGVKIISTNQILTAEEMLVVTLAAYLHDIGYTQQYIGHEVLSAEMAAGFLVANGLNSELTEQVKNCILATKFPQLPNNDLEKIVCDADFYHFSMRNYTDFASRLKREWEENLNLVYSNREWDAINIKMLAGHEYFTDYGKQQLQKKKNLNIEKLIQRFT